MMDLQHVEGVSKVWVQYLQLSQLPSISAPSLGPLKHSERYSYGQSIMSQMDYRTQYGVRSIIAYTGGAPSSEKHLRCLILLVYDFEADR